jgi:hypothetical protein
MTAQRRHLTNEQIADLFAFHSATQVTGPVHDALRAGLRVTALWFQALLPEGPLKTEAIGLLRKAMYSANAAVAVYGASDDVWAQEIAGFLAEHGAGALSLMEPEVTEEQPKLADLDVDRLARMAYDAYGDVTDHLNYQGLPMPEFDALGDKIQKAWFAAAAKMSETLYAATFEQAGDRYSIQDPTPGTQGTSHGGSQATPSLSDW